MRTLNLLYQTTDALREYVLENKMAENGEQCLVQIFSGINDAVLIASLIKELRGLLPNAHILAATTAGEIIDCRTESSSIVLSFSLFEKTVLRSALMEGDDSFALGKALAEQLVSDDSKVLLLFGNSLTINGSEMLEGVAEAGVHFVVAGGFAGNNGFYTNTFVCCNEQLSYTGLAGVSLSGAALEVITERNFGWQPIGKTMTVTKAKKNRVYTLDGQPTQAVYEKYLGQEVARYLPGSATEFPLLLLDDMVARCPLAMPEERDGSLYFIGNVPEGARVAFSCGNAEQIIRRSNEMFDDWADKRLEAIFIYSCTARYMFMQQRVAEEWQAFRGIAMAGFFTYGEYFQTPRKKNVLLNITTTILGLSEHGICTRPREAPPEYVSGFSADNFVDGKKNMVVTMLNNLLTAVVKDLEESNARLAEKNQRLEAQAEKLRESQEAMIQREKAVSLGHLMAGIAHNLKTPLMSSSGGLSLIRKLVGQLACFPGNLGLVKEIESWIGEIYESLRYISDVINTVNGYVVNPSKAQYDYEIDLPDVARRVGILLQHELKQKKCRLDLVMDSEVNRVRLRSHENDLIQVLTVLVNNAGDAYKGKGGAVKVLMAIKWSRLVIRVEDEGCGISPEVAAKLFREMITTKGKHGTGLGLYTTYSIIRGRFHGSISFATSKNGTQFTLELPLAEERG
ncbi:FIST N-terminal domain-containing protein [Azotosporobacter soli]|uniref:FIST N-terminal domain-containing protein n=1 Tax=Azotosporobacter soli TaxID=3055040 RepID=UPI0031FE782A